MKIASEMDLFLYPHGFLRLALFLLSILVLVSFLYILTEMQSRQLFLCMQDRGVEYRELAQREEQLQRQVIKLSEENMELKFEVEQANRDIPRLKVTSFIPIAH